MILHMTNEKLKIWRPEVAWDEAEREWEAGAKEHAKASPIKSLKVLPSVPGITEETAKNLKWKSFKYMVTHDEGGHIAKNFLRRPFHYAWNLAKSSLKTAPFTRDGDFFLYGIANVEEFSDLLLEKETLFVVGFSYCHKPFECPEGRFTDGCTHNPDHPVCRQCFIGKAINALPEQDSIPLAIPTIHYIGRKIFETVHANPGKKILFLITACEMTLQMFGDWGNMVSIKGIGVRLDGRICNTMKAFELSEKGVKPGLTVVLEETQKRILDLIRCRRERFNNQ